MSDALDGKTKEAATERAALPHVELVDLDRGALPTIPAAPPRTGGGRLDAGAGLFKPVAMGLNEVEDAAAEFNSRVQIVSPPPTIFIFKIDNLRACLKSSARRRITIFWRTIAIPASVGDRRRRI